ncbi:MAG: 3-hydroxyacyl-ACP dehydratase FabZ [Candidatus Aminicenantes bacterium]|nr:3-hydroxyacyl-ACP dehydratase FabZ [Candidatus Aminicenantes bacterium]
MTPPKPVNNNALFDIEKILTFLPHRYPFLLVDRVLKMEKGKNIICLKNVTYNEPFFQGHFPIRRIMPGVLVVEALAQTGGILLYNSIPDPEDKIVVLSKINNTKFRRPVVPGDQLTLKVEFIRLKNRICQSKGIAYVEDDLAVESEIMASMMTLEEMNGR